MRGAGAIFITSVFAALVLALLPMPNWASAFRPEWMVLVLIYWCMALPNSIGVITCWSLGLVLDVLKGTLLGQHALALSLVGWLVLQSHLQLRMYPVWQQTLIVAAFLGIYEFLMFWIDGISGHAVSPEDRWAPIITSILLWPWIFIILRDLRRRAQSA